jgi:succinate-semialdehyde dehydrogenase/glutarate-semialdehyde dehydrogenase
MNMEISTRNPYTGEQVGSYKMDSFKDATEKIIQIRKHQKKWAEDIDQRIDFFKDTIRGNFERESENLARLMTEEMGKPISQSISEVKKSIKLIDYLIENAQSIFSPENIKTEASRSYVRFDPLGIVMAIEPWNFPVWQVARAVFPALIAGNGAVLKHASIVTGVSLKIEELIDLPVFRSLVIDGNTATSLIGQVEGIAFTGSTPTGSGIASVAGRELKKVVMELGGSDPFIVLNSASIDDAAKNATFGRLQNNGQSCIASKRFIIHADVYDEFKEKMEKEFSRVKVGDPMEKDTYLGPLSSGSQKDTVKEQIEFLSKRGKITFFGKEEGNIIPPTIVEYGENYQEEVFGPVAILKKFSTESEAISMANESPFGLGTSIWGRSDEAERLVPSIEAGMVFINSIVFSDPRLPFGGIKKSGLGRELSKYGSREFTNMKTVWIS